MSHLIRFDKTAAKKESESAPLLGRTPAATTPAGGETPAGATVKGGLRYGYSQGKPQNYQKDLPTPELSPSDAAQEAILRNVAQAITDRIQSKASLNEQLLDEKDTFSATAVYTFSWRKPTDGVHDGTPAEPAKVTFSKDALNKMFAGKIDLSKPQYVHSAFIEEAHNSSPYPLHFTLDGIQNAAVEVRTRAYCDAHARILRFGSFCSPTLACFYSFFHLLFSTNPFSVSPLWSRGRSPLSQGVWGSAAPPQREFCNDGTASTMMLLPKSRYDRSIEIYRLRDVDPEKLRAHGNANLEEEVNSLTAVPDSDHVLVKPFSRIGQILKKNEHLVVDVDAGEELNVLDEAKIPMYAVKESQVLEILEMFNKKIISSLPKTDFLAHSASLRRADRTLKESTVKDFADATACARAHTAFWSLRSPLRTRAYCVLSRFAPPHLFVFIVFFA